MNEILFAGCTPTPLASYLKAMGIFRLVAEQKDPGVRACWRGERRSPIAPVLAGHKVPRMRQESVERALRRLPPDLLQDLLGQCAEADLAIKGLAPRDPWHQLATIADALANGRLAIPVSLD